jgi:hypothetical protein
MTNGKIDVQWHAIAFLLSELCVRTSGPEVERAWQAIDLMTKRRWDEDNGNNKLKNHLWKPLRRLMAKAKAAREKAVALERDSTPSSTNLTQHQTPISPILPVVQDSLMGLDYGVERSYPGLDANQNFQDKPMLWINPGLQSPVGLDQSMSMDITGPASMLTAMPQQLAIDAVDSGQLLQHGYNDTWMTANSDMNNSTLIGDGLNWEQWDDMVQELGMQADSTADGHSAHVPSVFGSGAGWY